MATEPNDDLILKHRGPAEYRLSDVTQADVWAAKSKTNISHLGDEYHMAYFQSALYASVLEDTITEFRILDECTNQLRIIKAEVDYGLLVAEKFGVAEKVVADELSGIDEKNLNQDTYTVNKLDKDRVIKYILEQNQGNQISTFDKSCAEQLAAWFPPRCLEHDLVSHSNQSPQFYYVRLVTYTSFFIAPVESSVDRGQTLRKFILTVLTETYQNLSLNRSFSNLTCAVEDILAQHSYRCALEQEEAKNKQIRRELIRQLRQQRNHNMAAKYDTDGVIDQLRTQVEDNALLAEARSRYTIKWQTARTEQHEIKIQEKESVSSDNIEFYKRQIDREQRAHTEIETIVNIITTETLARIEEWMAKYDEDMEAIDLKIQIMKNNYDNENDRRIQLEKTYAKHIDQMASWIEFKTQREKERLYRLKMNESAIIVQAWWRGIQVRFQLGPYKVRKRRGGRKK